MYSKQTNKMWLFYKKLSYLKCESRTSLHAVQYQSQPDSVLSLLCFVLIILEMASLDTLCMNKHFGVNSLFTI